MFNRRKFFGTLAGLFGLSGWLGKGRSSTPLPDPCLEAVRKAWNELGFGDRVPNSGQTVEGFLDDLLVQVRQTGVGLVWKVRGGLGEVKELFVLPTAFCVPQPSLPPDYPDGYYRLQPIYPYGPLNLSVGIIPVKDVYRVRARVIRNYSRYDGYSPLTALRLYVDEMEQMDKVRWNQLRRSV